MPLALSELALHAVLQLHSHTIDAMPRHAEGIERFVLAVLQSLARYDNAKLESGGDIQRIPMSARDDALLGAMGEMTGSRGTWLEIGGEGYMSYHRDLVEALYKEAFHFMIELSCAAQDVPEPQNLERLSAQLISFSRGAREQQMREDRRRFAA